MGRRGLGLALLAPLLLAGLPRAEAYSNGQLPQSALAPIYHPSYRLYLQKDAAASWNAMRNYIKARGVDIYPSGSISAYRTYSQQVYAKRVYGSNAATPGTSNHGWGLAVDLATRTMRSAIDRYGRQFGWAKEWSDASWEWWHLKYRAGVWKGQDPGAGGSGSTMVKMGSKGQKVKKVQRQLKKWGYKPGPTDGVFGKQTRAAVVKFQAEHGLKKDGIVGPKTMAKLDPPVLKTGKKGKGVKALQRALDRKGFDPGPIDGIFGPKTRAAVVAFQKARGLKPDGTVGINTRQALRQPNPKPKPAAKPAPKPAPKKAAPKPAPKKKK